MQSPSKFQCHSSQRQKIQPSSSYRSTKDFNSQSQAKRVTLEASQYLNSSYTTEP
jgi:hypothetical protein